MGAYLHAIWASRCFWLSLVKNDLQMRYRRSVLGIGWSLVHPLSTTIVMCTVFHEIFHVKISEYVPFVLSGLACWTYITGVTIQGCNSYVQAESYIRQHPLPLAVYSLRHMLGVLFHFFISLGLVLVLSRIFQGWGNELMLCGLLPGLVLLFFFGWAMATLAGFIHVIFRDTQHLCEVAFQVLFYLTPIVYPLHVLQGLSIGWLLRYHPLAPFLRMIREPILEGKLPSGNCYIAGSIITLVAMAAALATLSYQQRRVVHYL